MRKLWKRLTSNRRGVAILLAISILMLMFMLAMSFAATAMLSRKVALLGDHVTKSRHFADTALQTLIATTRERLADLENAQNFYPSTTMFKHGSGAWADHWYYISTENSGSLRMTDGLAEALQMTIDGYDYVPTTLPTDDPISWLPIRRGTDSEAGGTGDEIIGRYAYIMLDDSGKIDPSTVVSATVAEGSENRRGYSMTEIDLSRAGMDSSIYTRLRPAGAGSGLMPDSEWLSRWHLLRTLRANNVNVSQGDFNEVRNVLLPYKRADTIESIADYYDLSNAGNVSVDELRNQIPWFYNFQPAGNFPNVDARANQICASLRDYCDTDRNATRDSTSNPSYFGNEKVPYLNRIQFRFLNSSYYTNGGSKVKARLRVAVKAELVNVHGDLSDYTANAHVRVVCRIWFKNRNLNAVENGRTFAADLVTGEDGNATGTFTANGYLRHSDWQNQWTKTIGNKVDADLDDAELIRDIQMQIQRIYVRKGTGNSGDWWDFALVNNSTITTPEFNLDNVGDTVYMRVRCQNPYNNLNTNEWVLEDATSDDRFVWPNLGAQNPGWDPETPPYWSNHPYYIRNGPMQHLVELGGLLRFEPHDPDDPDRSYQTLNLVDYVYNGDEDIPQDYSEQADGIIDNNDGEVTDGEGNGGDRNILNMVRLGSNNVDAKIMTGRINPNTQRTEVLWALFGGIDRLEFHYDPDNPVWQDPNDSDSARPIAVGNFGSWFSNLTTETNQRPIQIGLFSRFRNDPVYGLMFQPQYCNLPELEREYLLMMTKEMVISRYNFFTALVVAQTIKDVGGEPPNELDINGVMAQLGRWDPGADTILAQQKVKAILVRDAFTNRITIERYDYLEE